MVKILHITEAGGGVLDVIKNISELDYGNNHSLLIRHRDYSSSNVDIPNKKLNVHKWKGSILQSYVEFRKLNKKLEFDLVHIHSSRVGAIRFLFRSKAIVYSPHCFAFERTDIKYLSKILYEKFEKILLGFTNGFMAVNAFESKWVKSDNENIVRMEFQFVTPQKHTKRNEKCIVAIGRICKQKDPKRFLEIINLVRNEFCDMEVIWVGEGDILLKEMLIKNNVKVTGWLKPDDVNEILARAALLLHTAKWEGMPIVFYEAWSFGLPIVTANANYLDEVSSAFIFDSNIEAKHLIQQIINNEISGLVFLVNKEETSIKLNDFYLKVIQSKLEVKND